MTTDSGSASQPCDHVMYVCNSTAIGGAEIYALELCRSLAAQGIESTLAIPQQSPLNRLAAHVGVNVRSLEMADKLSRRSWKSNLTVLRRDHAQLRRIFDELPSSTCIVMQYKWEQIVGGLIRPATTVHLEHGPIPRPLIRFPPTRRRLASVYAAARVVLAVNEPARDSVSGLVRERPSLLEAGVDKQRIAAAQKVREERRPRDRNRLVLGYCGRLAADKGVDLLIRAVALCGGHELVVIGDGPERNELVRLASECGVAHRVRFTGFLDEPLPEVGAVDVLALPTSSRGEGRPLAVLDALAVGVPVVAVQGNAALDRMAEDYPGWIALASTAEPSGILAAAEHIVDQVGTRPPPFVQGWESTARAFSRLAMVAK